jgi:septal ring factor EnvC (AmiA/AmiB activator)
MEVMLAVILILVVVIYIFIFLKVKNKKLWKWAVGGAAIILAFVIALLAVHKQGRKGSNLNSDDPELEPSEKEVAEVDQKSERLKDKVKDKEEKEEKLDKEAEKTDEKKKELDLENQEFEAKLEKTNVLQNDDNVSGPKDFVVDAIGKSGSVSN